MNEDKLFSKAIPLENLDSSIGYYVVNHGYGAYLKLGSETDGYNDRLAYVHESARTSDDRYQWYINHNEDDDTYSLQNFSGTGGFLFRGDQRDGDGDYRIWGHNTGAIDGSKGDRYKFKILPVEGGGSIYNIYTLANDIVKAGAKRDGDGDHGVYAQPHPGDGDRYQWIIVSTT
ncbi:hypothetical protein [Paraburkholderia terricola]|uniref:hypothetical protein n=1 Tax=Paraburkholderia terricola TaxID=169427 RepID=UPI003ECD4B31